MAHFEIMIDAQGTPSYLIDGVAVDLATFEAARAEDPFEAAIRERAAREAALAEPITPQPIEGTTVAEVKASAEAAIADLAQQMQDRLGLLVGGV